MAKKNIDTVSLIETFADFKENKSIDTKTMKGVLEDSFRSVIAKMFGSDDNYNVTVTPAKGECEIWRDRTVVADDEVVDPNREIALSEAQKISPDFEIGEEVSEKIDFTKFGRRAILNLRQTLAGKILDLEHDALYCKYKDRVGEVVSAEVYQVWKNEILLFDDEGNEMHLLRNHQIPDEHFHKGDIVRAVIHRVDNANNNPKIYLSRTAPEFLQRLLEAEVPEITDGLITIKKIARIPGKRAKIAVESYDDRIDPVGACVGVKGRRVHGIVRELHNENLDVIHYTSNETLFLQRALSPATISSIEFDESNEEKRRVMVYLKPKEVSLAIGREGLNIKLASMITGLEIDVFREPENGEEQEDDIYLDEFVDEVDKWVIDSLKNAGYQTARQVLAVPREELADQADLELDTVDDIIRILNEEFEQE